MLPKATAERECGGEPQLGLPEASSMGDSSLGDDIWKILDEMRDVSDGRRPVCSNSPNVVDSINLKFFR